MNTSKIYLERAEKTYCMLRRWNYEVTLWRTREIRDQISDLLIDFVFPRIILSNSLWNLWIKTFLLLELLSSGKPQSFCLDFKFDNLLYLTPKKFQLYTTFLHFDSIFTPNPQCVSLQHSLIPPRCWNYSLDFLGSLLKR